MKNLFKIIIRAAKKALGIGIATGTLSAFAAAPIPVVPYNWPLSNSVFNVLSNALQIPTATSSNVNSTAVPLFRDRSAVLHLSGFTTNGSGSNVNVTLQFANPHPTNWNASGGLVTNWEAPVTFNFANNLNNTTGSNFFFSFYIPKTNTDNYQLMRLNSVTNNHLSTLFLDPTNCFVSAIP